MSEVGMGDVARRLRAVIVASDTYRRAMADGVDISTNEAAVLGELLHRGPLTPTLIGVRTGLTPASTTALIDRLEAADLVERSADPDDRRRVRVDLTARGRAAIETMFSLFTDDLDEAIGSVRPGPADDPELWGSLAELLRAVAASLRARATDGARIRSTIDAATAAQGPAPENPPPRLD